MNESNNSDLSESEWVSDYEAINALNESTITKSFPKYGDKLLTEGTQVDVLSGERISLEDITTPSQISEAAILLLPSQSSQEHPKKTTVVDNTANKPKSSLFNNVRSTRSKAAFQVSFADSEIADSSIDATFDKKSLFRNTKRRTEKPEMGISANSSASSLSSTNKQTSKKSSDVSEKENYLNETSLTVDSLPDTFGIKNKLFQSKKQKGMKQFAVSFEEKDGSGLSQIFSPASTSTQKSKTPPHTKTITPSPGSSLRSTTRDQSRTQTHDISTLPEDVTQKKLNPFTRKNAVKNFEISYNESGSISHDVDKLAEGDLSIRKTNPFSKTRSKTKNFEVSFAESEVAGTKEVDEVLTEVEAGEENQFEMNNEVEEKNNNTNNQDSEDENEQFEINNEDEDEQSEMNEDEEENEQSEMNEDEEENEQSEMNIEVEEGDNQSETNNQDSEDENQQSQMNEEDEQSEINEEEEEDKQSEDDDQSQHDVAEEITEDNNKTNEKCQHGSKTTAALLGLSEETVNNEESFTIDGNSSHIRKQKSNLMKRKNKVNAFDVVFEETQSPENTLNDSELFKKPRFEKKKKANQSFNVSYEESVNNTQDTSGVALKKRSTFQRKNKETVTFNVSFNESGKNDSNVAEPIKSQPFLMKRQKRLSFDVVHNISSPVIANETQPSLLFSKKKAFSKPSRGSGKFQVDFEPSVDEDVMLHCSDTSKNSDLVLREGTVENVPLHVVLPQSGASTPQQVRFVPETEAQLSEPSGSNFNSTPTSLRLSKCVKADSIKSTHNTSLKDTSMNDSSFNDENLNVWMSDEEDEQEPEEIISTPERHTESSATHMESDPTDWEAELEKIITDAKKGTKKPRYDQIMKTPKAQIPIKKKPKSISDFVFKQPKLKKPASFATKRFYNFLTSKLKAKFGVNRNLKAEDLMCDIAQVVKAVQRSNTHQKILLDKLKKKLAKVGVIETTYDFYKMIDNFLPVDFNRKVIPRLQPISNIVWPPSDGSNPLEKIHC